MADFLAKDAQLEQVVVAEAEPSAIVHSVAVVEESSSEPSVETPAPRKKRVAITGFAPENLDLSSFPGNFITWPALILGILIFTDQ